MPMLNFSQVARYEESIAQLKGQLEKSQMQYSNCHMQVRRLFCQLLITNKSTEFKEINIICCLMSPLFSISLNIR